MMLVSVGNERDISGVIQELSVGYLISSLIHRHLSLTPASPSPFTTTRKPNN